MVIQPLFWMTLALFFGLFIGWVVWGQRGRTLRAEIFSLQDNLRSREARIEQLSQEVISGERNLTACEVEAAQVNNLRETVKNDANQIDQLTGDLTVSQSEVQRLEREKAELGEVQQDLLTRDRQIEELNEQLDRCRSTLDLYKRELTEACREVCREEDIPGLPSAVPAAVAADADDLKEISGVGPFLEGKLNTFGIFTFKQVAALTDDVVTTLGETFGSFSDRITRENWIEQAKILHAAKYGETI